MTPRIIELKPKLLAGKTIEMSYADNRTFGLWSSLMPVRQIIRHRVGEELYSLQVYPPGFFDGFDAHRRFQKWALAEVSSHSDQPEDFQLFRLEGGLYAVFDYRGRGSEGAPFFRQIFGEWLPAAGYEPDDRPHFEILGAKYRREDPDSEEEVWIPVRPVNQP